MNIFLRIYISRKFQNIQRNTKCVMLLLEEQVELQDTRVAMPSAEK